MGTLESLPWLSIGLGSASGPKRVRQAGDTLARAMAEARNDLIALGPYAICELALLNARLALDAAQERVTCRWDTRPSEGAVLRLVRAADCTQEIAVALLGGPL